MSEPPKKRPVLRSLDVRLEVSALLFELMMGTRPAKYVEEALLTCIRAQLSGAEDPLIKARLELKLALFSIGELRLPAVNEAICQAILTAGQGAPQVIRCLTDDGVIIS